MPFKSWFNGWVVCRNNKTEGIFCWHNNRGLLQHAATWQLRPRWHIDKSSTGYSYSATALLAGGQETSALGFHQGKSRQGWWRLWAWRMRMDDDILLSLVRKPIWLCQKFTGDRGDTRGRVPTGTRGPPHQTHLLQDMEFCRSGILISLFPSDSDLNHQWMLQLRLMFFLPFGKSYLLWTIKCFDGSCK